MPDGTGNQALGAPDLTDSVWVHGGKYLQHPGKYRRGTELGVMPAHGEFLGEARVHLLAAYVYSLSARE
jgi:cytochrome c oxidase cbb3-type subunit III